MQFAPESSRTGSWRSRYWWRLDDGQRATSPARHVGGGAVWSDGDSAEKVSVLNRGTRDDGVSRGIDDGNRAIRVDDVDVRAGRADRHVNRELADSDSRDHVPMLTQIRDPNLAKHLDK
jgi:hypothetical protein